VTSCLRPSFLLAGAMMLAAWREGSHQPWAHQLMTVVQQDRFAGPFERPSARVSARGLHVVFSSYARLVVADANQVRDVYVLDLSTGQLTLESVGRDGSVANGDSGSPDISGDGRYVVFVSSAGNLADTQIAAGMPRLFLRDRENATTRLLTTSASGGPANGYSNNPAISADGTTVVFDSAATDLLQSDAPNDVSVYLMRLSSSERTRLNVSGASEPRAGQSVSPSISADGRYIAFMSKADLTCRDAPACVPEPPDRNRVADVYVRDAVTNTTTRVSRSHTGQDTNGASYDPAISGDGRHVVFVSEASNLTRDSGRHVAQVYSRDIVNGVTELLSRNPSGRRANGPSAHPAVSHDGSTVAFQSLASDLLCIDHCDATRRDINLVWDVFVHDRRTRRTIRASAGDSDEEWMESSRAPSLDGTGRVLAFGSRHPINGRADSHDENLFVWVPRP
jgi:Tol biopolymer transport system component